MSEDIPGRRTAEAVFMPEGGTVTWVNEDVPELKAKVGDVVGMPFLFPPPNAIKKNTRPRTRTSDPNMIVVDVDKEHKRHSVIGTIRIKNKNYEIVLKGTGLLDVNGDSIPWVADPVRFGTTDPEMYIRGLCGGREADVDARIAQYLNNLGASCAVPLTITRYNSIPYARDAKGRLQYAQVSDLEEKGFLPNDEDVYEDRVLETVKDFVAYARALETNIRINDYRYNLVYSEIIRLFSESKTEIREETFKAFIKRTVERIGGSLGVMHALGIVNSEFADRNISIAGEITDLSACIPVQSPEKEFDSGRTRIEWEREEILPFILMSFLHRLIPVHKYTFGTLLNRDSFVDYGENAYKASFSRVFEQGYRNAFLDFFQKL